MNVIGLVLLLLALFCFIAATFNLITRINAVALGLALCVLAWLLGLLGVG